jgi:UDP-N-acetylglucosamine transferase subunit ALG13
MGAYQQRGYRSRIQRRRVVIFVTVGSHEPFDRLVRAMDAWCMSVKGIEVFGQITGKGDYSPRNFKFVDHLNSADYRETCRKTALFVAHAGMGSIITALEFAKPIVIMPRHGDLNETRNNHQIATARRFRGRPGIFVADDVSALPQEIEKARAPSGGSMTSALPPFAQDGLIGFLRDYFQS